MEVVVLVVVVEVVVLVVVEVVVDVVVLVVVEVVVDVVVEVVVLVVVDVVVEVVVLVVVEVVVEVVVVVTVTQISFSILQLALGPPPGPVPSARRQGPNTPAHAFCPAGIFGTVQGNGPNGDPGAGVLAGMVLSVKRVWLHVPVSTPGPHTGRCTHGVEWSLGSLGSPGNPVASGQQKSAVACTISHAN